MKRILYVLEDIWAAIELYLVGKKNLNQTFDFQAHTKVVLKKIDSLHPKISEAPLSINKEKIFVLGDSIEIGFAITEYLTIEVITGRVRRITCIDLKKGIYRIKTRMSIYTIQKVALE